MMTKVQHALCKLAEEASEVAQRAIKAQQFGMDEVQEGERLNNAERLLCELLDVMASLYRLRELGVLRDPSEGEVSAHIQRKLTKVDKYYAVSKSLGQVE